MAFFRTRDNTTYLAKWRYRVRVAVLRDLSTLNVFPTCLVVVRRRLWNCDHLIAFAALGVATSCTAKKGTSQASRNITHERKIWIKQSHPAVQAVAQFELKLAALANWSRLCPIEQLGMSVHSLFTACTPLVHAGNTHGNAARRMKNLRAIVSGESVRPDIRGWVSSK